MQFLFIHFRRKSVSFAKLTKLLSTQPKEKFSNLKPSGPQLTNDNTPDVYVIKANY